MIASSLAETQNANKKIRHEIKKIFFIEDSLLAF